MVFLDSDVLINFLRKDLTTVRALGRMRSAGKELSITSINSFDLLKGIPKSSSMDASKVIAFLNNFSIHDFTFASSKKAAEIFVYLKSQGEIIELPDIMIASIVLANNETLITENTNHFKRIQGLKIEKLT
jgi:predicted nucleic acid-binding protein